MIENSNNQNLLFVGGFSTGGNPAASRAFRRRRCNMMSEIKQAGARMSTHHCKGSEKPSGRDKTAINANRQPRADSVISVVDGFMRLTRTRSATATGSERQSKRKWFT